MNEQSMCESQLKQIERLKAETTRLQACLAEKNRQLDAMSWAWCSGGCTSGMHRWNATELTDDMVKIAERGVGRMRQWLGNRTFKAEWAAMTEAERDIWMKAALPVKGLEEEGTLKAKVAYALSEKDAATRTMWDKKKGAELTFDHRTKPVKAFLDAQESRFEDLAFDIACSNGIPPYARSGSRLQPDSLNLTEQGIWLAWDDDKGYTDYLITWETLENEEQLRAANNEI